MTKFQLFVVLAAAILGGLVGGGSVMAIAEAPRGEQGPAGSPGQNGPAGGTGPSGPAGSTSLAGAYVLTDANSVCPPGTTQVNAQVTAETNSTTGRSAFALCFVK